MLALVGVVLPDPVAAGPPPAPVLGADVPATAPLVPGPAALPLPPEQPPATIANMSAPILKNLFDMPMPITAVNTIAAADAATGWNATRGRR